MILLVSPLVVAVGGAAAVGAPAADAVSPPLFVVPTAAIRFRTVVDCGLRRATDRTLSTHACECGEGGRVLILREGGGEELSAWYMETGTVILWIRVDGYNFAKISTAYESTWGQGGFGGGGGFGCRIDQLFFARSTTLRSLRSCHGGFLTSSYAHTQDPKRPLGPPFINIHTCSGPNSLDTLPRTLLMIPVPFFTGLW